MQTAYNAQTGEYLGLIDGAWQPLKTASDGKGNTLYLDSAAGKWLPLASSAAGVGNSSGPAPAATPEDIDKSTGAPFGARFAIGAASSPQDKLARARAYFGDSVRLEDGGDVSFINPDTGKRTLVNPEGLDWGDVAGSGREIAAALVSIPAAAAATIGGGGLNLPAGAAAGAAAGAGAGQAVDALGAWMARNAARERGNAVPAMQKPEDAALEAAQEFALGTAGGVGMGLAGKGLSAALNPLRQEVVQAYKNLGLQIPSIGAAATSKAPAVVESAVGDMLTGSPIIEAASRRGAKNLDQALENIGRRVAGGGPVAETPEDLGTLAKIMASRSRDAFSRESSRRYGELDKLYSATPAKMDNVRAAIDDMTRGLGDNTQAQLRKELEGLVSNQLADEAAGNLNVATLGKLRSDLFNLRKNPNLVNTATADQGRIKNLLQAATRDYEDALAKAKAANGGASPLDEWRATQDWYKGQRAARKDLESRIFGSSRTANQVGEKLLNPNIDRESIANLQQILDPKDFDLLRGSIIRQLATPNASAGMDAGMGSAARTARLLGNGKGAYSKDVQDMLFGNALDDVRTIAQGMANAGKTFNTSRTASLNEAIRLIRGFPQWVQNFAALGDLGASVAMPAAVGWANTSPWVINALARPQAAWSRALLNELFPMAGTASGLAFGR